MTLRLSLWLTLTFLATCGGASIRGAVAVPAGSKPPPNLDPARELPRVDPTEPSAALATWQVRPGFALQLAAHEPQVRSPIAVAFDARGRMFVCEMVDYPEQRDVTPHLGRISRLEDRDGDGRYETSTLFADQLAWPTAVICAGGGVYVASTPDVIFLADADDDGVADRREVAFTGFGTGLARLNVQTLLNSATWGLDNRIHLQTGGGNRGVITCPTRPDLPGVELGGKDFWFDPRTREFGVDAGGAQYGMSFDSWGRRFACSNSDHLQLFVYDDTLVPPGSAFALPAPRTSIAADGGAAEVFRISPDEPWRIVRTRWRVGGVVAGLVEGGGRVSGYFTGATGTTVYRGDAFGPEFPVSTFTGDAGGQLVHRKVLTPDGVSFVGRRAPGETGREFAASTDPWVRVVSFANAPDGALYVCDMYREVIEHPWSIPEAIKKHLDLTSGRERGRLYRVVPDDPSWVRRTSVALDRAATADLVALLSHPNGWHRDTAGRLLYERQDAAAVEPLRALLRRSGVTPVARAHALAALEGLQALDDASLVAALRDLDAGVRERALTAVLRQARVRTVPASPVRLAPDVAAAVAGCTSDAHPRVRFHAYLAIPYVEPALRVRLMSSQARVDAADRWLGAALLHGADAGLFFALERDLAALPPAWVASLLETVAAADSSPKLGRALRTAVLQGRPRVEWLQALQGGFKRAGTALLAGPEDEALFAPLFQRATAAVMAADKSDAERVEYLGVLGLAPWTVARAAASAGSGPGATERVQVAAIELIARFSNDEAARLPLTRWAGLKPAARSAALNRMLARPERSLLLLAALESGDVALADLGAAEREALWSHPNAPVAERARRLLAATRPVSREAVVASFRPALALSGRTEKGREIYEQRCLVCHRAEGRGMAVGPDLVTVKTRGREGLLAAIVDPHREVVPAYVAYTVSTQEGATMVGLISRDDATGVALTLMGGTQVSLARAQIKGTSSEGKSLMPEGLEQGLDAQAMADLLSFIEGLQG
jgi:putative membrane-bound dehydrogenase-like protein